MPAGGRVGRPVAARTATAPNIANVNARGGGGQAAGTGSPAQQLQQQRGNAAGTRPGGATAAAGPANRRPVGSQAPQPWSPQTRRPWEKSAPGQLSQPRTAPANVSGKGPAAAGGKDVGEERGGTPSARASPDASMSNADPAAAGQPTRSQRSPLRRGDAQSAAPGATGGAAAGSGTLFRDGGMGETEGYPDGTLSAGLVAQARQLRPPLVQLQELLEQSAQPGLDPQRAGPPVDLSALSAALTAAAVAVQGYEARRIALTSSPLGSAQQSPKGPPAPGAFAGDAASSGAGSADALHTVFAELQRIQLQNARLEAQNRTILSHLGTKEQ